jgi:hypothetical protein
LFWPNYGNGFFPEPVSLHDRNERYSTTLNTTIRSGDSTADRKLSTVIQQFRAGNAIQLRSSDLEQVGVHPFSHHESLF